MKTVLVAINTQYIHTNPAVRGLLVLCRDAGLDVSMVELSINNNAKEILNEICLQDADICLFSCYLWNVDIIKRVSSDLKTVFPNVIIGVGGPQVSYCAESFLLECDHIDFVVCGEGEVTVPEVLSTFAAGRRLHDVSGICFRDGCDIVKLDRRKAFDMNCLPFSYFDLNEVKDRILYYESMRGCPFSCSYCLSGGDEKLKVRDINLVYEDMDAFLSAKVRQVKFVDRTFNAIKEHAMSIWDYLIENDNGGTNFHFEMSGELLDEDMLKLLSRARKGLFQFEIGVQSVNEETLFAIRRPFDFDRLSYNVSKLQSFSNIHLHLDLIAGLPFEDYTSFVKSFNKVYALRPQQLQLGFLKVLSGSHMEQMAEEYGIVYSDYAPFEVLGTKWLSYEELRVLSGVAEMVDAYYNSGMLVMSLKYLEDHFKTPFDLYYALWNFQRRHGYDKVQLSTFARFSSMRDFMEENDLPLTDKSKWLFKFDMLKKDNFKRFPQWLDVSMNDEYIAKIRTILSKMDKNRRTVHLEIMPFHPETGENGDIAVIFDYLKKEIEYISL